MSFEESNRKSYGGVEPVSLLNFISFPRDLHYHLIDVLSPLSQSETPLRLVVGLFKIPKN